MTRPSRTITRRTVLRGLGVSLGLPLLEIMRPVLGAVGARPGFEVTVPRRLVCLFMPNGVNPHTWTPPNEGPGYTLSETLQPLAPVRDEVLVLTNLWNAATNTGDGHYVKTAGWLTGTTITKTTGGDIGSNGVSMDQIAAHRIGHHTRLPSLELSLERVTSGVDANVGYTRLYGSHISWSTPRTPLTREIDPRRAFDRLFRSSAQDPSRSVEDASVLDLARADAEALRRRLGRADDEKLTEYLDSVRSIERRLEAAEEQGRERVRDEERFASREALAQRLAALPSDRRLETAEHAELMLDILALALWADATRVATLMFGNAVSNKSFAFLEGVTNGHHENSHHQNDKTKLAEYTRIAQWHVERFAQLLQRLKAMPEGEGSVLDQSMVLFGSGLRDGNSHSPRDLPILLGGRAGGTLSPGRHVVYPKNSPFCNLHRALLTRMNTPVDHIGNSTAELSELG